MKLTDITRSGTLTEAFLLDQYNKDRPIRIRAARGFDTFVVYDGQGNSKLKGKVLALTDREVVFQVGEKTYVIHLGQTLRQAMAKALTTEQVEELMSSEAVP